MPPEAWGGIGAVIAAGVAFAGSRIAARQARRAATRTDALSTRGQEWTEMRDLLEHTRTEVDRLRHRQETDRDSIDRLTERVSQLERRYRAAIDYIRVLLLWVAKHLPGQAPPEAPAEIRDEL